MFILPLSLNLHTSDLVQCTELFPIETRGADYHFLYFERDLGSAKHKFLSENRQQSCCRGHLSVILDGSVSQCFLFSIGPTLILFFSLIVRLYKDGRLPNGNRDGVETHRECWAATLPFLQLNFYSGSLDCTSRNVFYVYLCLS